MIFVLNRTKTGLSRDFLFQIVMQVLLAGNYFREITILIIRVYFTDLNQAENTLMINKVTGWNTIHLIKFAYLS